MEYIQILNFIFKYGLNSFFDVYDIHDELFGFVY